MGNNESIKINRENKASEDRLTELLEKQRKLYEAKCQKLFQDAQRSQPVNMTTAEPPAQIYMNEPSTQSSNTLYPNLNMAATHQPSFVNNGIQTRNNLSMCNVNNNMRTNIDPISTRNSNMAFSTEDRTLITPSAPTEPSVPIQEQKLRPGKTNNRSAGKEYCCETCGHRLGLNIFQCTNGHSSCRDCRMSRRTCGAYKCGGTITDMRNRTVEQLLADVNLSPNASKTEPVMQRGERTINCPNQHAGCKLHFSKKDMTSHLKECVFTEIPCPLASVFGQCRWRGLINQLVGHFIDCHPEHRHANVDTEMIILGINNSSRIVHLVAVGRFLFLVNVKLDIATATMYMAVQFFGTSFGASKWTYELHVYNKSSPRRKYLYSDVCLSHSVSTEDIFEDNTCAVLPAAYLKTFENNGCVNYKFYIKKQYDVPRE